MVYMTWSLGRRQCGRSCGRRGTIFGIHFRLLIFFLIRIFKYVFKPFSRLTLLGMLYSQLQPSMGLKRLDKGGFFKHIFQSQTRNIYQAFGRLERLHKNVFFFNILKPSKDVIDEDLKKNIFMPSKGWINLNLLDLFSSLLKA